MRKKEQGNCFRNKAGFFIVSIAGCICHFLYELSGGCIILAPFVPVNESIWEHLKLLFFPYIFYILAEYFLCKAKPRGFLFSSVTGVLCGLVFIPLAFYSYTSVTGKSIFTADILIYFAAVLISFRIRSLRISAGRDKGIMLNISALIIILCISALFAGFTFFPPASPLFESPPVLS